MRFARVAQCALMGASLAALLVPLNGGHATWPAAHIVVIQSGGQVAFEFFGDPASGSHRPRLRVYYLAVQWAGGPPELWSIQTGERAMATRVEYGVIPPGFVQTLPKEGAAPALKAGEKYRVTVMGDGNGWTVFTYEGP